MKKISEENIFDLIDGNLSEEEQGAILKELPKHPELEALYRSLLMTEGYIKSHAIEKPSLDFTDNVTSKINQLIKQKKRNGILYSALSIIGLITVSSIVLLFLLGTGTPEAQTTVPTGVLNYMNQFTESLSFLLSKGFQSFAYLAVAFAFFIFIDRILLNHFQLKH